MGPMDRARGQAETETLTSGWTRETRIMASVMGLLVLWVLTSAVFGTELGFSALLLGAMAVPVYLFRHQLTPAHLPYVLTLGIPVAVIGLWVS